MSAQTVIPHVLSQGTGVSLVKSTDTTPMRPLRPYLPGDRGQGDSPITVNLNKAHVLCDGCMPHPGNDTPRPLALYTSTDREGWVTLMCSTHARRWRVMR